MIGIVDCLLKELEIICWMMEDFSEKVIGINQQQVLDAKANNVTVILKFGSKVSVMAVLEIYIHQAYAEDMHKLKVRIRFSF